MKIRMTAVLRVHFDLALLPLQQTGRPSGFRPFWKEEVEKGRRPSQQLGFCSTVTAVRKDMRLRQDISGCELLAAKESGPAVTGFQTLSAEWHWVTVAPRPIMTNQQSPLNGPLERSLVGTVPWSGLQGVKLSR